MKKFKYMLIGLVATLPLILSSCTTRHYWDEEPLLGAWFYNSYDPDLGSYQAIYDFYSDGVCRITCTYDYYPQYNYSYDLNYRVNGDLYDYAIIDMWGYADGYAINNSYEATINGYRLTLYGIRGNDSGYVFDLTR